MNKIEPHRHIVHREIHIELYYVAAYVPMFLCGSRNAKFNFNQILNQQIPLL